MKECLKVQDLPENQLDTELTTLELEELEALKGGALNSYILPGSYFPKGIPSIYYLPQEINTIPVYK